MACEKSFPCGGRAPEMKRRFIFLSPNKSLLRSGGQWSLVCKAVVVMDKLPLISLGEPPAAELSR